MRGVEHVERLRSEAVFGLGISLPPRRLSPYVGIQRWLHQLSLDISSARAFAFDEDHRRLGAFDVAIAAMCGRPAPRARRH